jgi:carbamoyltransferase
VAPICLESEAVRYFDPGTPDPFMLFDHLVRPEWRDKIPAIRHLDNTARLQTISAEQNPLVHDLLALYAGYSGISLLCNTSANLNGSGFFPDANSAMEWGGVDHVWCNFMLYTKER